MAMVQKLWDIKESGLRKETWDHQALVYPDHSICGRGWRSLGGGKGGQRCCFETADIVSGCRVASYSTTQFWVKWSHCHKNNEHRFFEFLILSMHPEKAGTGSPNLVC